MIISQILTVGAYIGSIYYFQPYFDSSRLNTAFFIKILWICIFTWVPLHLFKIFWHKYDPSDNEKIMRRAAVMQQIAAETEKQTNDQSTKLTKKLMSGVKGIRNIVPNAFTRKNPANKENEPLIQPAAPQGQQPAAGSEENKA
jgi:hypothetical protein